MVVGGFTNKVELYSPNGKCQIQLAPLPNVQFRPSLLFNDGKIIACPSLTTDTKNCWSYNISQNNWSTITSFNFDHYESPGILSDNKLYVVDGTQPEVYDLRNNSWSVWPASTKLIGRTPCLIAWKDTILVIGGWIAYGVSRREGIQSFNTSSNLWTVLQGMV